MEKTMATLKKTLLALNERSQNLPKDTMHVPYVMHVKGELLSGGTIGDHITIKTVTGRILEGECLNINPAHNHGFGDYIPILEEIKSIIRKEVGDSYE